MFHPFASVSTQSSSAIRQTVNNESGLVESHVSRGKFLVRCTLYDGVPPFVLLVVMAYWFNCASSVVSHTACLSHHTFNNIELSCLVLSRLTGSCHGRVRLHKCVRAQVRHQRGTTRKHVALIHGFGTGRKEAGF